MEPNIKKLQDIDKKMPFKVPENYFAEFNARIIDELPQREFHAPKPISMWEKVKPWVYMAAMFLGFYVTINYIVNNNATNNEASQPQVTQQYIQDQSTTNNSYWSTVKISEEEFYNILEDQLMDDGYFDEYFINTYYLN
ncbi:MAG: hypothetical protein ACOYEA_05800 [Fermentimonas sp.]|jgi:hypothetical protein